MEKINLGLSWDREMSFSETGLRRPRPTRNGVYWGDSVARACNVLELRSNHLTDLAAAKRAATPGAAGTIANGTVTKLWKGYVGGSPVEEFSARPVMKVFLEPQFDAPLRNAGIDPAEVILAQEFRLVGPARGALQTRLSEIHGSIKRTKKTEFSFFSEDIVWRILNGGCITKRHKNTLGAIAFDELRKLKAPGFDDPNLGPDELFELVPLEDAFMSAYRPKHWPPQS
jgi:hypothetical protein